MRFENALGKNAKKHVKKCEKCKTCEKNTFEHPVGKVELGFFGVQFCCSYCAAQLLQVEIGEEQFKSIGSGLCRLQVCLIYL